MISTPLTKWITPFAITTALAISLVSSASTVDISYPATPKGVVAAFCQSYSEGAGLSSSSVSKVLQYTTWADTPGWDRAAVVRSYHIGSCKDMGPITEVTVRFDTIGTLESGESHYQFHAAKETEIKTFRVVNAEGQWRIANPLLPPHIGIDTAIRLLHSELSSMTATEAKRAEADISELKAIEAQDR